MSNEEDLRKFREYCMKYYGRIPEQYERLAKYASDIMTSWIQFRATTWKTPDEGGQLPIKFKELLAIGIETATKKPHVGHVEMAMNSGATVEEIAEVLGICIMLGGMESYEIGGKDVLERAENYAKKLGERQ
jgi:alkylhydroperoxidase/carboxymuconolactone decarboxylase family protein YurZ